MRDELFSCAGFPLDENSRVRGGNLLHLVENRFEGSTIADNPIESTFGLVPRRVRNCCIICHKTRLSRLRIRLVCCSHIQCGSDRFEQQLMIEWFRKELDRALSHRLDPHPGISVSSNEDDRDIAFLIFQPGLQLQT